MTNVRSHTVLGNMRWPRYHSVMLAALAHALRREASRWIVSATYGVGNLHPWGSHPDLDWRWGDEQVELVHFGAELWRAEKLAAMAGDPRVHRRLRVCYGDPRAEGNCGRCEKCVRTRLIYRRWLPGIRWPGAADEPPLAAAVDAIAPLTSPSLIEEYKGFGQGLAEADTVTTALNRLIERSESALARPGAAAVTFTAHGWKPQRPDP